jgi:hypothetical protein
MNKILNVIFLFLFLMSCTVSMQRINTYCKTEQYDKLVKFTTNKDIRNRIALINCIKDTKNEDQAISLLLKVAEYPSDESFRLSVEALGKFNDERIGRYYRDILSNNNYSVLRKICVLDHFNKYYNESDKLTLAKFLESPNIDLKIASAIGLARSNDFTGEAVVADLLQDDFFATQRKAIKAIGYFKNDKYVPQLAGFINDKDPVKAENARFSLKMILGSDYLDEIAKLNLATAKKEEPVENKKEINVVSNPNTIIQKESINTTKETSKPKSDVDINLPFSNRVRNNTYALIIGNEDYKSYQTGLKDEANVDFANNDATTFADYMKKVIGIPEENIFLILNGKAIEIHRAVEKLSLIPKSSPGNISLIFYYAGHGFPDESTKESFIIPVDVTVNDLKFAISLDTIYSKLTKNSPKVVSVYIDACFSGGARNEFLLSSRGVKIVPKENILNGNIIVFTACSGSQSALPYKEKYHGMFTYFTLKYLKESNGRLLIDKYMDYINNNVSIKSLIINNKEQNPQVKTGFDFIKNSNQDFFEQFN